MPRSILSDRTYNTAKEWYDALSDMHMAQLTLQYNDVAEDDDDIRDKYVARKLFGRVVEEGNLFSDKRRPSGEFRLYSQDLRPANVLLYENLRVVGVIDWEFAYAAPAEFTSDSPWWLLLLEPESWPGGYREWMKACEPRFNTFIRVLEVEEAKMETSYDGDTAAEPLSASMQRSWTERNWMVNYAVRDSWAFDFIWWKFLDEWYFGSNEDQDHCARLHLFTEAQKARLSELVAAKADERADRGIFEWDEALAAARVQAMLEA